MYSIGMLKNHILNDNLYFAMISNRPYLTDSAIKIHSLVKFVRYVNIPVFHFQSSRAIRRGVFQLDSG